MPAAKSLISPSHDFLKVHISLFRRKRNFLPVINTLEKLLETWAAVEAQR